MQPDTTRRNGGIINFSGIPSQGTLGRLLRLPLRLLPGELPVPILQGPLRRKRWIVGSSSHGCWLGSYEAEKQRRFAQALQPGQVVLDVGAHVGFYTLLSAACVGPAGQVIAFEPLPRNVAYLRQHLRLNGVGNVSVIEAAVADSVGRARFAEHESSAMGQISPEGGLEVEVVSLDSLFADGALPEPHVIKIDVEGAELEVLRGARSLLRSTRPTIFLATHARQLHWACLGFLNAIGYESEPLERREDTGGLDEVVATPRRE